MMHQLMAYEWPGNIRELENLLARAIVLSPGGLLDGPLFAADAETVEAGPPLSLEDAERRHIERVLVSARWVVEGPQGGAAMLNIKPSTLRSRMKRLGIQRPE